MSNNPYPINMYVQSAETTGCDRVCVSSMTLESANRDNDNNNNNGDQNIDRGPIVSALLTFAIAIYRNTSHDRIIQLLMSEFGIDEIKQSKHILCDVSKVPYQNRNSSNWRSENLKKLHIQLIYVTFKHT